MGRPTPITYPVGRPVTRSQTKLGIKELLPMLSLSRAKPRKRNVAGLLVEVKQETHWDDIDMALTTPTSLDLTRGEGNGLTEIKQEAGSIMELLQIKQEEDSFIGMPVLTPEEYNFTERLETQDFMEMPHLTPEVYDYSEIVQIQQEEANLNGMSHLNPEGDNSSGMLQIKQEVPEYVEDDSLELFPMSTPQLFDPTLAGNMEITFFDDQIQNGSSPIGMMAIKQEECNTLSIMEIKEKECSTLSAREIKQEQTEFEDNGGDLRIAQRPEHLAERNDYAFFQEQINQIGQESTAMDLEQKVALDRILMPPPLVPAAGSWKNLKKTSNFNTESSVGAAELEFVSDDTRLHSEDCPYTNWALHRACLSSDMDIQNDLMNHFMLEKCPGGLIDVTEVKQKCAHAMREDSPIMKYIRHQRNLFDSYQETELQKCKCETARLLAKTPETLRLLKIKKNVLIYRD